MATPNCRRYPRYRAGLVAPRRWRNAPHPQELLSSKEFLTLSQNAQRNYGVVIYDTPPALESSDAFVVASRVGAAIVAARRHRTKVQRHQQISKALEGFQCDIAGTVLSRF